MGGNEVLDIETDGDGGREIVLDDIDGSDLEMDGTDIIILDVDGDDGSKFSTELKKIRSIKLKKMYMFGFVIKKQLKLHLLCLFLGLKISQIDFNR